MMRKALSVLAGLAVAGCMTGAGDMSDLPAQSQSLLAEIGTRPPEGAGGCYQDITIAKSTMAVVMRTVAVTPARYDPETGEMIAPATYQTRPAKVEIAAGEMAFERMCASALTPDFVAMLQRALAARGLYEGPVSGQWDDALGRAVAAYQAPRGLDSPVLSRRAAMEMGLIVWEE